MTREEAVARIKDHIEIHRYHERNAAVKIFEALDMAIKALEQTEPCKDAVSRQAAIDAVHKNYDTILDFKSDGRTVAYSFEDIINALPSAQPERKWIPVTNATLPDNGKVVIALGERGTWDF